jgi:hypothetical protein
MRATSCWTGILALCAVSACGGSGSTNDARQIVGGASGGTGAAAATFHGGSLPAPHGSVTATAPTTGMGINGGSTNFTVSSSTGTIVTVYVSVSGESGYWEIPVPPGTTVADILLTFAQQIAMGRTVNIIFEVVDSTGNVSQPVMTPTQIIVVGTGDVAVALSWDVNNDLDLHVVDPTGNEVYYGNTYSTDGTTMLLDLDSNAGCAIDGVNNEHVVWPHGKAPHGTYTVRVDNWQNCQSAAANYVVTVEVTGHAPQTFQGSFAASDPGDNGSAGSGTTITTFTF